MKFIMPSTSVMYEIRLLKFMCEIIEYSLRALIVIKTYLKICSCQYLTDINIDLFSSYTS